MSETDISPIELCPVNFNKLEQLNKIVGNIEEALILAKIKFHQFATKLSKSGVPVIARSRKDISSWFNLSQRKTDRCLSSLSNKGLLNKSVGLFYGKRKLFLSVPNHINDVPINIKLLDFLVDQTGSLEAALVFSRIAFTCALTSPDITCYQDGISFSYLKKTVLAEFVQVSIRTLDKLLNELEDNGFILKKNLIAHGKRQMHFHIPALKLKELKKTFLHSFKEDQKYFQESTLSNKQGMDLKGKYEVVDNYIDDQTVSCQNCRLEPAKMQTSIKVRTTKKETINNTTDSLSKYSGRTTQTKATKDSDISSSFTKISNELTRRQKSYLEGALKKVVERHKIKISDPNSLLDQLTFAITHPQQRRGISSFTHAVSRFMKILAQGNWRTPIGFHKHDSKGVYEKEMQLRREADWQKQKQTEIESSRSSEVLKHIKDSCSSEKESLTEKAIYYAKYIVTAQKEWQKTKDSNLESMINESLYKIKSLLKAGADRGVVTEILKRAG